MVPFAHRTKSKLLSLTCALAQLHIPRLLIRPRPGYLLATVTISPKYTSSSMAHPTPHSFREDLCSVYEAASKGQALP